MWLRSDYRNYINSQAWRERRRKFLYGDPPCNRCGISRAAAKLYYDQDLNVHHRNYQNIGCEPDSDLEALCRRCHEIESNGKTELPARHLSHADRKYVHSMVTIGAQLARDLYMNEYGLVGVFE
jgi:hypothetical protein